VRSSSRSSRATAASWLQLATNDELKQWEEKRGGFWQHDTATSLTCSFEDANRVRLRHSAESLARTSLRKLDVDTSKLRVAAVKLLRTSHGRGQQEIHYDIREYCLAVRCYTVLMYLTPTLSTAMPTNPMKDIRCCFTEGEKLASEAALKLITRDKFVITHVEAGDMMICNCAVPH
jgi:hypothetical protein